QAASTGQSAAAPCVGGGYVVPPWMRRGSSSISAARSASNCATDISGATPLRQTFRQLSIISPPPRVVRYARPPTRDPSRDTDVIAAVAVADDAERVARVHHRQHGARVEALRAGGAAHLQGPHRRPADLARVLRAEALQRGLAVGLHPRQGGQ